MSDHQGGPGAPEFPDIAALAAVFAHYQVRYVLIGGSAAQMYVPELVTHDADFTPAADRENLERLSRALRHLEALIRTDAAPEGIPFDHSGESLARAKMWNLQCRYGAFDITFEPAGGGYDHLAPKARVVEVRGVELPVADLADVVASKRLADRPKDRVVLPQLEVALAERGEVTPPRPTSRRRPLGQDQQYRRPKPPSPGPHLSR